MVTTFSLVSGCATNPFANFPSQVSQFFGNAGTAGTTESVGIVGIEENSGPDGPMPAAVSTERPAAAKPANDLSRMLERVADTALANGGYGAAARLYGRSRELAPGRPGPALGLARASRRIGDHRTSVKAYRAVLAMNPVHPAALREIARELMDLGAPGDAIPYLKTALMTDPDPRLYNELGIAHDLTGNYDAAQQQFRIGLTRAPGDLTLRANLGRSLAFAGKYPDAIMTLQAVVNSRNATPRFREALAMAHAATGDLGAALRVTRRDAGDANNADRRARYAMIGELVRNGEPSARADLVSGTVQRDRYAGRIGQPAPERRVAATVKPPKSANLMSVLASIDARSPRAKPTAPAPYRPEITEPERKAPEIAAETGPKPLYRPEAPAPASLNLAPSNGDSGNTQPIAAPITAPIAAMAPNIAKIPDSPAMPDIPAITDTPAMSDISAIPDIPEMPDSPEMPEPALQVARASLTARPTKRPRYVYHVQLAAYRTEKRARKGWDQLVLLAPKLLDSKQYVIVTPDPSYAAGDLLRLRTGACNSRADAKMLCDALKRRNLGCIIVRSTADPKPPRRETDMAAVPATPDSVELAQADAPLLPLPDDLYEGPL
jgi:Flp pilus assembly protein TadD